MACVTLAAAVFGTANARGNLASNLDAVSVASCSPASGDRILTSCCLMAMDRGQIRHELFSLDLNRSAVSAAHVPTPFAPQQLVPLATGEVLSLNSHGGILIEPDKGCWKVAARAVWPIRPDYHSALVLGNRILLRAGEHLAAIDLETNQICWQREDLRPTCFATTPRETLICALPSREIIEVSAETGETRRTVRRCQEEVAAIAVSSRTGLVACLNISGRIEVWSPERGRPIWARTAHGMVDMPLSVQAHDYCPIVIFSPDGKEFVTAACERQWVLAIWDAYTGERLATLRGHDAAINGAAYLPDGTLLSWACDGTLRVWDPQRGVARRVISMRELCDFN
jgi:hypothetical protein